MVVDDDGHTAGDMLQHRLHDLFALGIGQHELLGEIGQDADAVGAGVDHEVDAAPLTVQVERAAVVEDGRRHRKDTPVGPRGRA